MVASAVRPIERPTMRTGSPASTRDNSSASSASVQRRPMRSPRLCGLLMATRQRCDFCDSRPLSPCPRQLRARLRPAPRNRRLHLRPSYDETSLLDLFQQIFGAIVFAIARSVFGEQLVVGQQVGRDKPADHGQSDQVDRSATWLRARAEAAKPAPTANTPTKSTTRNITRRRPVFRA